MQTDTHGNGNGLNDLYILPETPEEREKIIAFLKANNRKPEEWTSDVPRQGWYSKRFFCVPFSESLEPALRKHMAS